MKKKLLLLIFIGVSSLFLFSFIPFKSDPPKPFVVVLDAGHGGKDSGTNPNGYIEKDIALTVVLKVGAELEKLPNFKVIYTRKTDVFLELTERAAIANKADADVFVSVHCNSSSSQAYGVETYVMGLSKSQANLDIARKENEVIFLEDNYKENYAGFDPSSPESMIGMDLMQEEYLDQSIMLAGLVQNNIVNNLKRKDRSVKQARFWVLHNTYMPSILIETGFLTNTSEGAYVNSEKGRSELAHQIANGVVHYRNNLSLGTEKARNPQITEIEIQKAIDETKENIYKGIDFKVQLAASKRKLDTKPQNFKGLTDLTRIKEDGLYKYYYGDTSDYNKIQLMRTVAQEKGYTSCYIVAFRNGRKLKLTDVIADGAK